MIVVTGATGFIGSQIIPRLAPDTDLLLVSRDIESARHRFPGLRVCDYRGLGDEDLAGSIFIHLAARNNDRPGTPDEFRQGNVDCLLTAAATARRGGAQRIINLCTTHALDPLPNDLYGESKREGARKLAAFWPEGATNLYVPAVYGESFHGRLAGLNRAPTNVRKLAVYALRQIKPMISVDQLLTTLQSLAVRRPDPSDAWDSERYAADPLPRHGLYAVTLRSIDLLAAVAIILVLGWAMVLIALYVRLDSPGAAIFAQQRIGRGARPFVCYKFRTMTVGTLQVATHDAPATAVTRAGRMLRRTKLDELPQVFNILRNEMSLVGPRPCLPVQQELIDRRSVRGVLKVRPGITGLAQINDIDMSDPARLAAWDDRYCSFRTILGDAIILLRTFLGRGAGDRIVPSS